MAHVDDPLAGDPFFRVLNERHPEVDLVILPQVTVPAPDEPRVDPATARTQEEVISSVLDDLGARLGPYAVEPRVSWRQASQSVRHQATGRAVLATREPVPTLRRLGDTLFNLGWSAGPVPGGSPRLEATRDGVRLTATAMPGGIRVHAEGEPLVLSDEAAAELLR